MKELKENFRLNLRKNILDEAQKELDKYIEELTIPAIMSQEVQIFRAPDHAGRWYYSIGVDDSGIQKCTVYRGITSFINSVMPESLFLTEWKIKHGDKWREKLDELADYGTALHTLINEWIQERTLNVEVIKEVYKEDAGRLIRDLMCVGKFFRDCKVKVIHSEKVFGNVAWGLATALDLVCEMTVEVKGDYGVRYKTGKRKGEPKITKQEKTITAIIDFKSLTEGKAERDFYESHIVQLQGCKMLYEHNGGKVDAIFNWAPKAWRTEPDYTLVEQTGKISPREIELLVELFKKRIREPYIDTFSGEFSPEWGTPELKRIPLSEYLLKNHETFEKKKI